MQVKTKKVQEIFSDYTQQSNILKAGVKGLNLIKKSSSLKYFNIYKISRIL